MSDADKDPRTPGPLRPDKMGESSERGRPQPEAAEVESARQLANDAREELRGTGFSDERIRQLADQFIAEDRGEGTREFVDWAKSLGP
jgi:hypothetical protein